jgi:hypothetical protein
MIRFSTVCCLLVIAALLAACQTVDRGSFGSFMRSLNSTSYGYKVVADPTGSAPTKMVERFEVQPGDCSANRGWSDCANDRERSELSERDKSGMTLGTTRWYGWSLFVPEDYINVYPTKVALGQFHQHKSHTVWMFQNSSGGYHLDDQVWGRTSRYYKLIDENDLKGKWHRIEVHVKWSTKGEGFFKVWANGEQKVDYSGRTMDAIKTYFKYGLYRSFLSKYKNAFGKNEVPGQVVYFANVRQSLSREGLTAPTE